MAKTKAAIVTGAAGGIGRAISLALAADGWCLWLLDKNKSGGRSLQKKLRHLGHEANFVFVDLAKPVMVKSVVTRLRRKKPQLLVNNAAESTGLHKKNLADWNRVMAINLTAPWILSRILAPAMPRKSSIINIASTRALMSEKDTDPYTASKGGLVALTHGLAISLQNKGIRVNAISPGWIHAGKASHLKRIDHAQHPVGRVGRPEDIAHAVLYLADQSQSGFLTGQNIVIDGGMTKKMIYR